MTTVLRCWFTTLLLITTQGRVLLISEPTVGSRFTHQISPRLCIFPGFRHCIAKTVEIALDFSHISILICDFAGLDEPSLPFGQLVGDGIGDIAGTVAAGTRRVKLFASSSGRVKVILRLGI